MSLFKHRKCVLPLTKRNVFGDTKKSLVQRHCCVKYLTEHAVRHLSVKTQMGDHVEVGFFSLELLI